jgi:hypothetical protein
MSTRPPADFYESTHSDALPPPQTIATWRVLLRILGALIVLGIFARWAASGYHQGWSKNQVLVERLDPVTEITEQGWEKRFVPGLDFLCGGVALGLIILAATFWPARGRK